MFQPYSTLKTRPSIQKRCHPDLNKPESMLLRSGVQVLRGLIKGTTNRKSDLNIRRPCDTNLTRLSRPLKLQIPSYWHLFPSVSLSVCPSVSLPLFKILDNNCSPKQSL